MVYSPGWGKAKGNSTVPVLPFMLQVGRLWSQPKALAAEFGAANVTTDARSLARLYTPLAMNGVQDGRQVVGPETVREFTTPTPSE